MSRWRFSLEPVADPALFHGRTRIIQEIQDLMTAGTSPDFVFVHGPQKIGRTSLLKHLHRPGLDLSSSEVRTCFVDLRLWSLMPPQEVIGHFAAAMEQAVRGAGADIGRAGPYLFDDLVQELARQPDVQLVLLIDSGDALLDSSLQRVVATLLGMLNDSLPNLGIVLSFGTGEYLSGEHMLHRMEHVEDAIREISPVWTRAKTRVLGALPRADTLRFLDAAASGGLSAEETAWVVDLAGDHPFLLNRVGLTCSRIKASGCSVELTPGQRSDVEMELGGQLVPMARAIVQRLSTDRQAADLLEFAYSLAAEPEHRKIKLPPGSADAEAISILVGEGLLQAEEVSGSPIVLPLSAVNSDTAVQYWMPSRLLREALLQVHNQGASGVRRAPARVRDRPSRVEAVVKDDRDRPVRIALTDIERRILDRFLQSPESLLGPDELVAAVWGAAPDVGSAERWHERLKQRLSRLRRKLAPYVPGEPIVNVYGRGYRLAAPDRIILSL